MICPSLKVPLDITDGLDVVVGEEVWYVLIIKYLAHFRLFHYPLTKLYVKLLVCLIGFFTSQSINFQLCRDASSWVYQYLAVINVSCSRKQHSAADGG